MGHVSYVIGGVSFSWEGENDPNNPDQGVWTIHRNPADYTNDRRKTSAGVGFVLDFGSRAINEKFKRALISGYAGEGKYDFFNNNCGHAFQRAINAIAGDLKSRGVNIKNYDSIDPKAHRQFIESTLKKFIVNKNHYPKASGGVLK